MKKSQRKTAPSTDSNKPTVLNHMLKNYFGYRDFKSSIQRTAVVEILKRETDILLSVPAGFGRLVCYQLPILINLHKVSIVFMPDLTHIKEQVNRLVQRNILYNYVHTLSNETTYQEKSYIHEQLYSTRTHVQGLENHFIYMTPDQASTDFFLELLSDLVHKNLLGYIILDESYHAHDWSTGLNEDYELLKQIRCAYLEIPWVVVTTAVYDIHNFTFFD